MVYALSKNVVRSNVMLNPAEISLSSNLLKMIVITYLLTTVASTSAPTDWAASNDGLHSTTFNLPTESRNLRNMQDLSFRTAFIAYRDETLHMVKNKSEVGKFGEGFVAPFAGYVYHVVSELDPNDHSGCDQAYTSTSGPIPTDENWIALIKRGKCNFEDKVNNAFLKNAIGVLVYDDRNRDHLDRMKLSTDANRNISAVFTYKWKGEEIAALVDHKSRVFMNVTIGNHTLKPFPAINRTSVLFVSISFIVLMVISLTWLIFYYVQRFRYMHAKDKLSRQLCNAAKKALSRIPTKNIKADDKEIEGDGECCAICIEPYKISDVIRILPCRHEFHKYCIDPWLLEHRTCPMCKMDILKYYGFAYTGSQESILHVDIEEPVSPSVQQRSPSHLNNPSIDSPFSQVYNIANERQTTSRGSSPNDFESMPSSRATTPDELTPSLEESRQQMRATNGRQELCMACLQLVGTPENSGTPQVSKQVQQAQQNQQTQTIAIDINKDQIDDETPNATDNDDPYFIPVNSTPSTKFVLPSSSVASTPTNSPSHHPNQPQTDNISEMQSSTTSNSIECASNNSKLTN